MRNPRVLVVDDEPETVKYVSANLRIRGYEVLTASDGHAALTEFGRAIVDLVILDIMMPGPDGFEVCRAIRRQSDVPILMLSARGREKDIVHVELDPERVAGFGLTLDDLSFALLAGNDVRQAGSLVSGGEETPVQTGVFMSGPDDIAELVVGVFDGRPVFLGDIAQITHGSDQPESYAWFASGPAFDEAGHGKVAYSPAVTMAVSKKPGTNATRIADSIIERLEQLRSTHIPDGVETTVYDNSVDQSLGGGSIVIHSKGK